jgi:hypothetical protein
MIVSDTYKVIFIHCRKVAGSSMKVAIAPHLSGTDLVIGSLHEIMRAGIALPPAVRRILRSPGCLAVALARTLLGQGWKESVNIAVKKHFEVVLGSNPPHPTAENASQFLGPRWCEYTKFCFVRNPFERVASDYFWRQKVAGDTLGFADFVKALIERDATSPFVHSGAATNWEMMTAQGEFQVDLVGRYENLQEDWRNITTKLGLPATVLGTVQKAGQAKCTYGSLYSRRARALVEELCRHEIDYFGYKFPY